MLAKYPFLTDEDFTKSLRPAFASRSSGSSSSRPNSGPLGQGDFIAAYHGALGAPPDVPELENEVAVGPLEPMDGDDVDSELARLREDVAEEAHAEMYFYARVRGGRWTAANRGVTADAISGYARGGIARAFCDIYNFPKEMSFFFRRYGDEGSRMLTNEFRKRGDYFCDLWVSSTLDDFVFTQQMLDDYTDAFEFIDWLCAQPMDSPSFARGNELRLLGPKLGWSFELC
jgi:hypothetical protein